MGNSKQVPPPFISRDQHKKVHGTSQHKDEKPSWRFSTVDLAGPFQWPRGSKEEQMILSKLHNFDSMLWSKIEGPDHHFLSSSSLSKEAQQRLAHLKKEDSVEQLFSFHLAGKPRIICIRQGNIALLLWYDPEHKVAPAKLRNT